MAQVVRIDNVRRIVDQNSELLALVIYSVQNSLLFKLQINIQDSFAGQFQANSFRSNKLNNPTPLQYAIIQDKVGSLKGILNFMKKDLSDSLKSAGNPLDTKEFFCPTVSNTTWPLLHLAAGLERLECLKILIDFLRDHGEIDQFINKPDNNQRTPLAIAFSTGNKDIINLLIENGADPFYGVDKGVIMPIIYVSRHNANEFQTMVDCINSHIEEGQTILGKLNLYHYDDNGFAYSNDGDGSYREFDSFKENNFNSTVKDKFDSMRSSAGSMSTAGNQATGSDSTNTSTNTNTNRQIPNCSEPGCSNPGTSKCVSCERHYCEEHLHVHGC